VDKPTEHRVRANALLRGGDAAGALAECDRGLAAAPRDPALHILRGKALFELDRLDDAAAAYAAAVEVARARGLEPRALAEAQLGLAVIATRCGRLDEARVRFRALVDLDARNADAQLNLARVCLQLEDLGCALEHGEQAGRLRGDGEDVLFTLGRIYVVSRKLDEADRTFAHICEVVPGASSCPYGAALVAAHRGDKARALAKIEEALARKLPSPHKLGDDPLLAPLADEPAFRALRDKAASRAE
jgi:tetratricopeptide (TPR) repeat protein